MEQADQQKTPDKADGLEHAAPTEQDNVIESVSAKTPGGWKEDAIYNGTTDKNIELVATNNELEKELHNERKNGARRLFVILGISIFANLLLGYGVFGYFPLTKFIAVRDAKAVCEIKPLSDPLIDNISAGQFAVDAVLAIYTFDHLNFQKLVSASSSKYLTPEFRQQFLNIFSNSTMLDSVRAQYSSVAATVDDRVQITRFGINQKGVYSWDVQVPLLLTVKSGPNGVPQRLLATVTVVRQTPTLNTPQGLGIDNVVIQARLTS